MWNPTNALPDAVSCLQTASVNGAPNGNRLGNRPQVPPSVPPPSPVISLTTPLASRHVPRSVVVFVDMTRNS